MVNSYISKEVSCIRFDTGSATGTNTGNAMVNNEVNLSIHEKKSY